MGICKPVLKVDKDTREVLERYSSTIEAAIENNVKADSIRMAIYKNKNLVGYKWERAEGEVKYVNGVKRGNWSKDEVAYLRENSKNKSVKEIAQHLKRGEKSVGNKIWHIKVCENNKKAKECKKGYHRTELDYILSNYGSVDVRKIAKHLKKDVEYVLKTADYIAELYPFQEKHRILGITKMYRARMAAEKLYVGQKTKFGKIKEIYTDVVLVSKNGRKETYTKMEIVGFTEVRSGAND